MYFRFLNCGIGSFQSIRGDEPNDLISPACSDYILRSSVLDLGVRRAVPHERSDIGPACLFHDQLDKLKVRLSH